MFFYLIAVVISLFSLPLPAQTPPNDSYISGYATALLRQNLNIDIPSVNVRNGVVYLPSQGMDSALQSKAVDLLSHAPGVNSVKFENNAAAEYSTVLPTPDQIPADEVTDTKRSVALRTGLLPQGHLFKPLLADPRWAHFSLSYRNFQTTNFDGRDIGSVSFGETIPIYRANFGHSTAQWETGIQGAVFSDFNLNASSTDLINSDFTGALYGAMRAGQFSAFARLFHQSSHLGDEFLIRNLQSGFQRVNLSFEGMDLRLSYEFPYGIRLYGGGGGLFRKEPSDLKPWSTQYGIEFRSPWRFNFASMRPIVAADFKNFEQNDWSTDVSVRAGVEFDNLQVLDRKLQILFEYFYGYAPSGQFYNNKVEYLGLGAHFYF